jgi:nicotinate-nucleotide adenylyltransferase
MTRALYGGAFDPPHNGHVALARAAREQLGFDTHVVLVSAAPGHKRVATPAGDRLALARAAFPGDEVVLDPSARTIELLRDGGYDGCVFLVGADEFAGFLDWVEPDAVLDHVRLAVATRPGYPRVRLEPVLARLRRPERVVFFAIEPWPVSSTELRARVARGDPIDEHVPAAVAELVRERGLYRRAASLH